MKKCEEGPVLPRALSYSEHTCSVLRFVIESFCPLQVIC